MLLCGIGEQGQLVRDVPASARARLRAGHAAVPLIDAPDVTTPVIGPPRSRSPALAGLIRTAAGCETAVEARQSRQNSLPSGSVITM